MKLSDAEANHLRRLLGWVDCEIGQTPEEYKETLAKVATKFQDDIDSDTQQIIVEKYLKSKDVPDYIRKAVKALKKALTKEIGTVVDGEFDEQKRISNTDNNSPSEEQ